MATAVHVPVEEYLRTLDYEPDCEYVDGVIEERPTGRYDHASWQYAIQLWFSQFVKPWNIKVRPEYRVRVSATRYRVPDVCVFDRTPAPEPVLTRAPIAVFEVLSPEDRLERVKMKLEDYQRMGIQTIVVVDPETEPATLWRYVDGTLNTITEPVMELTGSACSVDWRRVRELLDE